MVRPHVLDDDAFSFAQPTILSVHLYCISCELSNNGAWMARQFYCSIRTVVDHVRNHLFIISS